MADDELAYAVKTSDIANSFRCVHRWTDAVRLQSNDIFSVLFNYLLSAALWPDC